MRCKQGDLARITGGTCNTTNIGKLVVVGERHFEPVVPLPSWRVYSISGPLRCTDYDGVPDWRLKGICPDAWLTPENPPKDPEEIDTSVEDARELVE